MRGEFTVAGQLSRIFTDDHGSESVFRCEDPLEKFSKLAVDDHAHVSYDSANTGKEVIQKYMSSNHSEVAAA